MVNKDKDLIEYSSWEGQNPPPENLKTEKQLTEIGLAPKKAVAIIRTKTYDCLLFDINNQ